MIADDVKHRASSMREYSISIAQKTLANAFDYVERLAPGQEPQEFAHLRSEFISRQADLVKFSTSPIAIGSPTLMNTMGIIGA